jgi:hypothetical protein
MSRIARVSHWRLAGHCNASCREHFWCLWFFRGERALGFDQGCLSKWTAQARAGANVCTRLLPGAATHAMALPSRTAYASCPSTFHTYPLSSSASRSRAFEGTGAHGVLGRRTHRLKSPFSTACQNDSQHAENLVRTPISYPPETPKPSSLPSSISGHFVFFLQEEKTKNEPFEDSS